VPLYPVPNPRPDVTPGGQFITPAGVDAAPPVDLTLSPAGTDTAWTGSTAAIQVSLTAAPAAATTSWTGSTPTLQRDAAPAPNAATVAWAGTTPAVQVSVTTSPAAASVAWTATTPTLTLTSDRTLTPTVAITAWTGTTPTLSLQSDRTLSPAAGTVAWAGSTPGITGASSLTLTPAAATTAWAGSTPALQLSRVLTPAAATVAWTGSTPTLRRDLTLTPAAPGARTYAGTILGTSNVQGYWRLGETTGTTAVDQTGHANGTYLGTITKGTPGLLTGDADKAATLDAAQSSRVEITSPPAPTTAVTVEAWAQDTGSTDFYAKIAARSNSVDAAPFADYCLSANSADDGGPVGRWVMEADINGTHTVLYTTDPVPAGRHHLVGTYDGTVMRLYLDGVEAAAPLFVTGTLGNRGQPLEIGRYSPNLALCKFVGTVDEVAVYDRALTAAEVLDHYTLGAQVQNSVVFWQAAAPDVQRDLNRTPAAGTVAWTGSTPSITGASALTLNPSSTTVTWTGSTPSVTGASALTLTPEAATIAWTGAPPVLIRELTLTPDTGVTAWTGTTPVLLAVPDVIPVPPVEGGGAWTGEEDTSEVEVRNLTLHPSVAVVHWTGSRPKLERKLPPLRVRLPRFRRPQPEPVPEPAPPPPPPPSVRLAPGAAVVAWTGIQPELIIDSWIPEADYQRLQRRIKELEAERDEETLILAALTAD
jgi:hypothetical protein